MCETALLFLLCFLFHVVKRRSLLLWTDKKERSTL